MKADKFDQSYYQRFYFAPETRVAEPAYFTRLAHFTGAYLDLLGCPVSSILDAGCGAGLMHDEFRRLWPGVDIEAFDASAYACKKFGWTCATLEEFASSKTYDLVVCHDVVQYLERKAAAAAIEKLARLTRTALLFGVLTREDWEENCDQRLTDAEAHLRSSGWYRRRLSAEFRNAGGGLYIRRDADVVLYSLESL